MSEKGFVTPLFLVAVASFILLWLGGCAKPVTVPGNMMEQETLCMREVAKVQISMNASAAMRKQQIQFKDERNAVMVIAIEALARNNNQLGVSPFIPCTLTVQNYLQENGAIARSNNQISQKALGALTFIGGAVVIGNSIEGIVKSISSSGATSISNSRVVQNSDNLGNGSISASGTGLGVGNTVVLILLVVCILVVRWIRLLLIMVQTVIQVRQ